jgi:hypothetical protein
MITRIFKLDDADVPLLLTGTIIFSFYILVEAHQLILSLASQLMPVRLSFRSFRGQIEEHSLLLLWRGYSSVLSFQEFLRYVHIYHTRALNELQSVSRPATVEDTLPGYIFLLGLALLAGVIGLVDVSWWSALVVFLLLIIWWYASTYRMISQSLSGFYIAQNQASIEIIEKRFHELVELTEEQRDEVDNYVRDRLAETEEARVVVLVPIITLSQGIIRSLSQ